MSVKKLVTKGFRVTFGEEAGDGSWLEHPSSKSRVRLRPKEGSYIMSANICGLDFEVLMDSAAAVHVVPWSVIRQLEKKGYHFEHKPCNLRVVGAGGESLENYDVVDLELLLAGE